jgi:hypothetical protein
MEPLPPFTTEYNRGAVLARSALSSYFAEHFSEARMRSDCSNRYRCAGFVVVALLLVAAGALRPMSAGAAGAIAVALPPDVAKGGFSYGYANDKPDVDTASARALELCKSTKDAANDPKLRALCKVVQTYVNQCVAVVMDPGAGTPGVGWSVAADKRTAEAEAMRKCQDTAGADRRAACVLSHSDCDGTAQ